MSANQLHNLGFQHLSAGAYAECVRVNRSVLVRKRMVRSAVNLGVCLHEQGNFEEAEVYFDQALAWDDGFPKAILGRFLARRSQELEVDEAEVMKAGFSSWRDLEPVDRAVSELVTPRGKPRGIMGD